MKLTAGEIRSIRFLRSGVLNGLSSIKSAISRNFAVQSQILAASGVSVFCRVKPAIKVCDFESALFQSRTVIRTWGPRDTLHLFIPEDWGDFLCSASNRKSWAWQKHRRQGGTDFEWNDCLHVIETALAAHGIMERTDLARLCSLAESSWGGILIDLAYQGVLCHADAKGGRTRIAHRGFWLGSFVAPRENPIGGNVLLRYLTAYGPARLQDFAFWYGIGLSDAKQMLKDVCESIEMINVGSEIFIDLCGLAVRDLEKTPSRWIRMIPRFDPLLLAHKDKNWLIAPSKYKCVWRPAGHIEACVVDEGGIKGTWRYDMRGRKLVVTFCFFELPTKSLTSSARSFARRLSHYFTGIETLEVNIVAG